MGYRSDVAYIIAGPKDNVISFLVKCRIAHPEVTLALKQCTVGEIGPDLLYIGFSATDVKWYPDYPDVITHNVLWDLAGVEESLEGRKCIVGENDDDNQTDSFGDSNYDLFTYVEISRYVSVNFSQGAEHDVREQLKEALCPQPSSSS
jgi:hypothetical protein